MFDLFKKKHPTVVPPTKDGQVPPIGPSKFEMLGRRWAARMQARTNKLSLGARSMAAACFCICAAGTSGYLIADALFPGNPPDKLHISRASPPLYLNRSGDEGIARPIISKGENERLERFRSYMDSLARSPTGRAMHDSIIAARPGMMDSIDLIQGLYSSQKK